MDTRDEQMFPTLDPGEIECMRRFGEVRHFGASDMLAHIGEVGPGYLPGVRRRRRNVVPGRRVAFLSGRPCARVRAAPRKSRTKILPRRNESG
jgi:hypothetical protein